VTRKRTAPLTALSHPSLPRARALSGEITDEETWATPSFPIKALPFEHKQPLLPITTDIFSTVQYQPVQAKQARQVQLGGFRSHIGLDGLEQSGMTGQRHHGVDLVEAGDGLGGGGGSIFVPVRITWKPTPTYSEEARYHQIEGEVVVDAQFSADGTVHVLRFVERLGHGLDEIAVEGVEAIKFMPASVNGEAVDVQARAHVEFHLFP